MRRVLALAVAATVVIAIAACTDDPAQPGPSAQPSTSASAGLTAPPPSPGDPAVTKQVCTDAVKVATDGTKIFNDQLVALEKAAAKGDQTAMVAAAEAIHKKFTEMAAALGTLSQKSVSPSVKAALTDASAALTEIASETYAGTMADTKKKLTDLALSFTKACT